MQIAYMALQANTVTKLFNTTIECPPIRSIVLVVDAFIQGMPASHHCGINGCSRDYFELESSLLSFCAILIIFGNQPTKGFRLLFPTLLTEVMLPGLPYDPVPFPLEIILTADKKFAIIACNYKKFIFSL